MEGYGGAEDFCRKIVGFLWNRQKTAGSSGS